MGLPFRGLSRIRPSLLSPITYQGHCLLTTDAVTHPSNQTQIYVSRTQDPYLNLSIEHFLLQKSPPGSTILYLYVNSPSVVIGRNQNPWLEVNMGLLGRRTPDMRRSSSMEDKGKRATGNEPRGNMDDFKSKEGKNYGPIVQLVRRRSGGGAVFHDQGNTNYSVICPPAEFNRDKHAEMVARALRGLGAPSSIRVNERHDIVVDLPELDSEQSLTTRGAEDGERQKGTFKISGSAYKLTRHRGLHHGTCLLSSPNLADIGRFLRSPAEPYVKGRGIGSVRSPVRNIGVPQTDMFEAAVISEFTTMYGHVDPKIVRDDVLSNIPEIKRGYDELKSKEWIYDQTPQFAFSTHPTDEDPRPRPSLPNYLSTDLSLSMTVRHGQIIETQIQGMSTSFSLGPLLQSVHLHEVKDWTSYLDNTTGNWLNNILGVQRNDDLQ